MPKRKTSDRSYSPRKLDIREVKQRFLIVCEGEKTEPYYFKRGADYFFTCLDRHE
jgi:hypothetical protein